MDTTLSSTNTSGQGKLGCSGNEMVHHTPQMKFSGGDLTSLQVLLLYILSTRLSSS